MKYRKKPVIVEATQWMLPGDHDQVTEYTGSTFDKCEQCGFSSVYHGSIKTLEGEHIVCPRDWVITGVKGEHYPCKPDIFEETYEPVPNVTLKAGAK